MAFTSLHERYSNYHYCIVPKCKNTSIKTPEKLWIRVPADINMRNTWLKLAKRGALSTETQIYFCEDHFHLENDMENYMQYKIMGSVKRIRMRPQCVPSRFDCQTDRKRKLSPTIDKVQHDSKTKKKAIICILPENFKQIHHLEMSTLSFHQDSIAPEKSSAIQCNTLKQQAVTNKKVLKTNIEDLKKIIKKLQVKKNSYAMRLKKTLKL